MAYFLSKVRMNGGDDSDFPDICIVELNAENRTSLVTLQKASAQAKDLCPKEANFQYLSARIGFVRFCELPERFQEEHPDLMERLEQDDLVFLADEVTPEAIKSLESASDIELETVCVWGDGEMYFRCYGKYNGTTFESVALELTADGLAKAEGNIILIPV